ncbi:MAG: hypothetical protein QOF70_5508 [Acetobacteraceae bacterium]|jgi:hypothetical protein|nr:hypothetical protein [Acetobacteraceae bacterium]
MNEISEPHAIAEPLYELVQALNECGVAWCYWKSRRHLNAALSGRSDLDLLAIQADHALLQRTLMECGFKLFPSAHFRDDPGVASFLGFDEASGRLLHVHVHFVIVMGHALLKNYRLPWARSILSRAVPHPTLPIRMPDPATEALLLLLRRSLDVSKADPVALHNWREKTARLAAAQEALRRDVDRAALHARAIELLGEDLAEPVTAEFFAPARPVPAALGRKIRRTLAPWRRYNAAEALLRASGRAAALAWDTVNTRFLHAPRPMRRRPFAGGLVIAMLGVDGSGKTTLTRTIRTWLVTEMDVMPIYFGTGGGRPSLILAPLKVMVPLARKLMRRKPAGASHGQVSDLPPGPVYGCLLALWATALAIEKRRKLTAAYRGAARGAVVVADRFPQDQLPSFNDGPLLPRLRAVPAWLRRFEARSYALARRLPPDLVIRLDATLDVLGRREPDMDRAVLVARTEAVTQLVFPDVPLVAIDATAPLDEVVRRAKREIWRRL